MSRARSRDPKKHQHCLRLTVGQELLLKRYTSFRDFDSEMDSVRAMIDGLEDWFRRQEAKHTAVTSVALPAARHNSGLPRTIEPTDVEPIDVEPSVGDFGGRPSVRLPESRHDGIE